MSIENFRETVKGLMADMVYHCNVDSEDIDDFVDPVLDKIMAAMPKPGITIDLAGAMDKITPDMMDAMKDTIIKTLTKRAGEMQRALSPFANCVFNDNGDVTVSDTHKLRMDDFIRAYHAHRGLSVAASEWMSSYTPPVEGTVASVVFQYKWGSDTLREIAHGALYRDGVWFWFNKRLKDKVLSYHVIPQPPKVK